MASVSDIRRRLTSAGKFAGGGTGYTFSAGGTELTLTKGDVDMVQRAKAAIGVGILVLCGHAGVGLKDLGRVCVGGAFGRYLDVGNAQAIGLLPPVPPETVELAGNTASEVGESIRKRFHRALEARKHAGESVPAGREYVEAYVSYVHYVENLHSLISSPGGHHEDASGEGGKAEHGH